MSATKRAPKTRTGCQNCRLRHLRCDELRPSCARCQKAGIACNRSINVRFKHSTNPSIDTGESMELEFDRSQPWVRTAPKLVFNAESIKEQRTNGREGEAESLASDSAWKTNGRSSSSVTSSSLAANENLHHRRTQPSTSSIIWSASDPAEPASGSQLSIGSGMPSASASLPGVVDDSSVIGSNSYHSPSHSWTSPQFLNWTLSPSGETSGIPDPMQIGIAGPNDSQAKLDSSANAGDLRSSPNADLERITSPQTLSAIYLDAPVWPLNSRKEAELMRYYVERLARDFDLTDPQMHFRNVVPQRAAICPLLLNAIFALSARHLSRVSDYDELVATRYHQQCLESVKPVLDDPAALLDENLLASTIILRHLEEIEVPLDGCSPPDSQPHLLGSRVFIEAQRHVNTSQGLGHAAFWVGLRQEIYVAFVNQRTIATALGGLSVDLTQPTAGDHEWSCRMVALCADVIRYCYGEADKSNSSYDKLATLVDKWHDGKNHSFTPIFFSEAADDAVLPDIWLLSDEVILGWQHYYIAKLLLSAHNPRVPGLGPGRTSMLRAIDDEIKDYVKVLCAIAISNPDTAPNFTYASMAIVAAGDKFTELREQRALLHVLDICDSQYGFPTEHARRNLKSVWGWNEDLG